MIEQVPVSCAHCFEGLCKRRSNAAGEAYFSQTHGVLLSAEEQTELLARRDSIPTFFIPAPEKGVFVGVCSAESAAEQTKCDGYTTTPPWQPPSISEEEVRK